MLVRPAHNETFRVSVAQISVLSTRTCSRGQARLVPPSAPEASRAVREVSTRKRGAALMNDTETSLRLMVILVQADSDSFDTSATASRYAAEGVDITLVTAAGGQRRWSASAREPRPPRGIVSSSCARRTHATGIRAARVDPTRCPSCTTQRRATRSRHASAHASPSRATCTIERSVSSTADERSKATCSKDCGSTTLTSQSLRERTDWTYRPRENPGRPGEQTMTTLQG